MGSCVFMESGEGDDRVNRETLWQVLRMFDVGGTLLRGIKSMYVNSLGCIRVNRDVSKCFRTDSGMRQGCIMSPWLFDVYMDAVMKEVKMGMRRIGVRFLEEEREWRLAGLLYADDSVLCS